MHVNMYFPQMSKSLMPRYIFPSISKMFQPYIPFKCVEKNQIKISYKNPNIFE